MWGAAIFYICEEIGEARASEGGGRGRSIGGGHRPWRGSWGELRFFTFVRKLGKGGDVEPAMPRGGSRPVSVKTVGLSRPLD